MTKDKQGAADIESTEEQTPLEMIDVRMKALREQRQKGMEAMQKLKLEDTAAAGALAILESLRRELAPDEGEA